MVLLFICGAETFCVEHEHLYGVAVRREAVDRFSPDPYTLLLQKKVSHVTDITSHKQANIVVINHNKNYQWENILLGTFEKSQKYS